METSIPSRIIEWIPYNNLENIKYLTKGGFSEIYTADGGYEEWDSKEQQLIRSGTHVVILKELKNVENASQNWFEEAKSHLTLSNKNSEIAQCFGLTKNPSNGNYMLVIERPKIISEIPSEYKSLMEQCWDANPLKRPDIDTLFDKISEIKTYYQNNPNELPQLIAKVDKEKINNMSSKLFTSKIYEFENLPEPKNATEEEQKAFYISRSNDFTISSNASNLSKSSNQYIPISSNDNDSKESPRLSKKLKIENVDVQNDYEEEFMQRRSNIGTNDEVQNNPSLHSEQDKSEILDDES
ncbi:hypothetical protein RhiirA1_541840 [Rhizophagus irregularis]|uniref:Rhodanese domain-containing protein n=1 Tax=Rhizophagus irregularis TaxID=588596 RepID=A0A2N0R0Z3_9GLOM|nr:hypothetical protein RhiirA1_541840 [Rhizophagus irregularis]